MRERHNVRPSARRREKRGRKEKLRRFGQVLTAIQLGLSALFVFLLYWMNVLPLIFLGAIAAVLIILLFVCRILMGKAKKKARFYVGVILAIIISAVLCIGNVFLFYIRSTLQDITSVEYEFTRMGVYVLKDDQAQTISDAADYEFGILDKQGREDTNNAIVQINEELDAEIVVEEYEDAVALADGLLGQECRAILLNEAFVEIVSETEGYESFGDQIREIASYKWKSVIKKNDSGSDSQEGVFTVFISGIDVAGDISAKSRSDVNILAVVNTNTHVVQLISTPRDYYVPLSISDGVKDKLTHAGIYGVDVSMDTLEMLYGTDIDYYFRVNFSGFQKMIDAMGGITVHSDFEFDAGGYHFNIGDNDVNGAQALAFARERYAFADGDRQRGRNQMAVISGVISKMQSLAMLQNFSEFMTGVQGSFESNVPYELLTDLVRDQLSNGGSWHVYSFSVDGTGTTSTTYSMNQPLYVMEPDMSTVEEAKRLIEDAKK